MVAFPLAPRFFGWAAGFSYTLYAIHLPLVFLIVAIFQNIGFPRDQGPPSPVAFMEFGVTIAICLLAAFLVSLVSERKTGQVRAAMMRMCPPRMDRKSSGRGVFDVRLPHFGLSPSRAAMPWRRLNFML
jgi:peptidoglycan/LPS O-acetylase OafA/YrhL